MATLAGVPLVGRSPVAKARDFPVLCHSTSRFPFYFLIPPKPPLDAAVLSPVISPARLPTARQPLASPSPSFLRSTVGLIHHWPNILDGHTNNALPLIFSVSSFFGFQRGQLCCFRFPFLVTDDG